MNTELKQYVFAGYIGQKVCEYTDLIGLKKVCKNTHWSSHRIYESILLLRPLSAITDSEAVEVAKLQTCNDGADRLKPYFDAGANYFDVCLYPSVNDVYETVTVGCYQYLQQQGIALPIFYKGEFYSVERLVELGIYKLTE